MRRFYFEYKSGTMPSSKENGSTHERLPFHGFFEPKDHENESENS